MSPAKGCCNVPEPGSERGAALPAAADAVVSNARPSFPGKGGNGASLISINLLAFMSHAVQFGTVPALIALRLNAEGHSTFVVGLIAAVPWITVMLLGREVPRLICRYSHAVINAVALAVSALAVLVLIFTGNPVIIFAANLCLGMGLILRWIACDSWLIALAPQSIRGRVIGIYETLMGFGIAVGPLVITVFGSRGNTPLLVCLGFLLIAVAALFCVHGLTRSTLDSTLLQFAVGYMADAAGFSKAQIITAAAIFSASVILALFGNTPAALLPALFILGGASGGMNTLAVVEAGAVYAASQITAATTRIALAYTVGSVIGPPFLGGLVTHSGSIAFPCAFAAIGFAFCALRMGGLRRGVINANDMHVAGASTRK